MPSVSGMLCSARARGSAECSTLYLADLATDVISRVSLGEAAPHPVMKIGKADAVTFTDGFTDTANFASLAGMAPEYVSGLGSGGVYVADRNQLCS